MASKVLTQNDLLNVLAHINLGDDGHMELTQAEFDQLTQEEKDDGTIYFITDGVSGNVFLDDNTPIGTIAPYGGTSDPTYWLICDGRAISRTAYSDLFTVIGTAYGEGDGSTTFNIPDLRGRVPMGTSANYDIGESGGEATHTLTVNEMPSHTHTMLYTGGSAATWGYNYTSSGGTRSAQTEASGGIGPTGDGQAHNNMQPYVVTNYIIKASSAVSESQPHLDMFYPVGSYYETSDDSFDPNIAWGGTWERETAGYVHLAKGDFYYVEQNPVVNLISTYYELIDSAYVLTSDTEIDDTKTYYSLKTYSSGEVGGENKHKLAVSEMPIHSHAVPVPNKNLNKKTDTVASGSDATVLLSTTSLTSTTTTASSRTTGSGLTHNNMQPYIVVNRWHRTA